MSFVNSIALDEERARRNAIPLFCPRFGCHAPLRRIVVDGTPTGIAMCSECYAHFEVGVSGYGETTLRQAELIG